MGAYFIIVFSCTPYFLLTVLCAGLHLPSLLIFTHLNLQETEEERSLRTRVFVQGAFHWSVSLIGYCILFIIGCVAIPHVFSPVKVCAEFTLVSLVVGLPVPIALCKLKDTVLLCYALCEGAFRP